MGQLYREFVEVECPDCGYDLEVECAVELGKPVTQTADCPVCDEVIQFER